MEKVKVRLESKNYVFVEYDFVMEKDFNIESLFLKIIEQAKKDNDLKNLYITDYNSKDFTKLLNWLGIDNSKHNGIDTLMEKYDYYYLDLTEYDNEGIYLFDLDKIRIFYND